MKVVFVLLSKNCKGGKTEVMIMRMQMEKAGKEIYQLFLIR